MEIRLIEALETNPKLLSPYIDHTLLKPDASREMIARLCEEAMNFGFATVCIHPVWVPLAAEIMRGSDVAVCTVIGFPLGASMNDVKSYEARRAMRDGARELDMVINIGALKSGDIRTVEEDIRSVVLAAEDYGGIVKVILETCLLTQEEKIQACRCAQQVRAHFVKTSTGFSQAGATVDDVRLMKQTVRETMRVKASGGINTFEDALEMLKAGADRLGTRSGVRIVTGK